MLAKNAHTLAGAAGLGPVSSVDRRITMTVRAISTTGQRLIYPAVQFISTRTQPAPLRCALTPRGRTAQNDDPARAHLVQGGGRTADHGVSVNFTVAGH